jgi:hypothetical protein
MTTRRGFIAAALGLAITPKVAAKMLLKPDEMLIVGVDLAAGKDYTALCSVTTTDARDWVWFTLDEAGAIDETGRFVRERLP